MIATKQLRGHKDRPPLQYGHVPGIRPGKEFLGREELAAVNIHSQGSRGIDARKDQPAYAIALSGGYADDDDGVGVMKFIYTGEGGQDKTKTKQITDQQWVKGNLALKRSYEQQTALRVVRQKGRDDGRKVYVYEGLHRVTRCYQEPTKSGGPLVCKFEIEGIPGQCIRSTRVKHRHVLYDASTGHKGPSEMTRDQRLQCIRQRPGLVCEDISGGREKMPLPVFNEVDDTQKPEFTYILDYTYMGDAPLALAARHEHTTRVPDCGTEYSHVLPYVNGFVNMSDALGIVECASEVCTNKCKGQDVLRGMLQEGVMWPLEVFRTQGKGWGVRCSEDLPGGAVIGAYVGKVMTSQQAEQLQGHGHYLYNLDHFHHFLKKLKDEDEEAMGLWAEKSSCLHLANEAIADMCVEGPDHLVIDAEHEGNVCRLINHSCQPNCTRFPVFTGQCRNFLLYYVVLVAERSIPAFQEITYDYNYLPGRGENPGDVACHCGAAECRANVQQVV